MRWRTTALAAAGLLLARTSFGQTTVAGRYLAVDSSHIYYEECGKGPAVVLLHDGLVHSVTWDAIWPSLCARYHVVRYDRRGMGRSSAPKIPFIPTEDLTALLGELHIATATLVGSSSGAGLAIDYAFRHPDKVERLLLIGPVVHGMASSAHFTERGARNNAPLEKGDVRAAAKNWANDPYQIMGGHDRARRLLFEALEANPQNLRYRGDLELHFAVPAAARIAEIRAPTLILVGESDIADVHAYAGAIELGIWGARREVLPGAGHLVQLEQPELVVSKISWLIDNHVLAEVPAPNLQSYAGSYDSLMYGRRGDFLVKDNRLTIRVATERDLPLFPSSDSTFYALAWDGVRFTFHRDSTNRVTAVDVTQHGVSHRSTRVPG